MSNKRIDHAAGALAHLDDAEAYANDAHSYRVNGSDERSAQALSHAAISAQQAQVHATLARVEQQRVANLIALAESGRTTVNGARAALAGLYDGSAEEGSAYMSLRPDIAAALGIEVPGE